MIVLDILPQMLQLYYYDEQLKQECKELKSVYTFIAILVYFPPEKFNEIT